MLLSIGSMGQWDMESPSTKIGFTSLTLTLVGDAATLLYTGATGWVCTSATSGIAGTSADMLA